MIEVVSGVPAPQFDDESSPVQESELVQGSNGSCVSFSIDVIRVCFRVPPNNSSHTPRGYAYHSNFTDWLCGPLSLLSNWFRGGGGLLPLG
jgi:hypothetical protein